MSAEYASANLSSGFNINMWAATAANLTQYAPSVQDLLLAGPRVGMKLGSYLIAIPEAFDNVLGGHLAQRVIPDATTLGGVEAATTGMAAEVIAQAGTDMLIDETTGGGIASRIGVESARSFGNIFSYSTSRWAVACIVMAIGMHVPLLAIAVCFSNYTSNITYERKLTFGYYAVLNRTHIYASPRRNLNLGWRLRFLLRIVPIALFALQARTLLQSIQCQTSPDFALMRWGNASKSSELLFIQDGGVLHTVSSTLLLGASDEMSCRAVSMIPSNEEAQFERSSNLSGSLSRLWPLFQTLCFSQFVETMSCALQGRQIAAETGMTLFEHSLAFAEAEAAVSSSLGWGPFGEKRGTGLNPVDEKMAELAIKRSMIMKRVNTPAEVLLVGFLSSMNHLTSHVLGIFNLQGRLRLASTAFWGICFMSAISLSIFNFSIEDLTNQSLLRFPTVCIIGFIPHVLVLAGILLCAVIYSVALLVTILSPPSSFHQGPQTFMQKLICAHENMQANVTLSNIKISRHMDFYQALLKTGYNALTIASEAVYLNESSQVNIKQRTWLEEDRLRELEEKGVTFLGPSFRGSHGEMADDVGLVATKESNPSLRGSTSGYSKERTARKGKMKASDRPRDGVGATERSGRWIMVIEFFLGIGRLITSITASGLIKLLSMLGIERRPRWLNWLVKQPKIGRQMLQVSDKKPGDLDFWLVQDDGTLRLPRNDEDVDIESEMRRRLKAEKINWEANDEQELESNLYGWWLNGGWWGSDDSSGTFVPRGDEDDDNTSVITSTSQMSEADEEEWDSENDDGRRTPTQSTPQHSRQGSPMLDTPLSNAALALLLHPRTPEQRATAQTLAAHLSSDTIITRSRFRKLHDQEKTKILTSGLQFPGGVKRSTGKISPEEEVEILEHLILSRRAANGVDRTKDGMSPSWAEGASGMGEGGPQCVVCQSAPRSIIVWPCRCLSLCDDCRITLAMNNFDKCVCCRRDVGSFSRIFVP